MKKKNMKLLLGYLVLTIVGIVGFIISYIHIYNAPTGLPPSANSIINGGVPEEVLTDFQNHYSNTYVEGCTVFPIAYGNERTIKIQVGEVENSLGGHWEGTSAELTLNGTEETINGMSREDEWSDFLQGSFTDAILWITVPVAFSESDYHQYFEGTASVRVKYPGASLGVNTWSNQSFTAVRKVRFFIISPEERTWMIENLKPQNLTGFYILAFLGFVFTFAGISNFCITIYYMRK